MESARYRRVTESNTRSEKTRIRLLQAASRIFAEKGFQESTVAEICRQAEANVASINYHFGDKETIYLEAWRYAFKNELAQLPLNGGTSHYADPEQRLAGWIRSLVKHVADQQAYSFAILHQELAHPSRVLADIFEQELLPLRQQLFAMLRACLGQAANERSIHYCYASIMGQCFQLLRLRHISINEGVRPAPLQSDDIEAFANHVVCFSLAGVRALRSKTTN